jgi:signal transduction histidine kinase
VGQTFPSTADGTLIPSGTTISEGSAKQQRPMDLVAEYVHNLRTPLMSIGGYARMLLEESAGPLNSTQKEYLTIVAENTQRVAVLLAELARLAASEANRKKEV